MDAPSPPAPLPPGARGANWIPQPLSRQGRGELLEHLEEMSRARSKRMTRMRSNRLLPAPKSLASHVTVRYPFSGPKLLQKSERFSCNRRPRPMRRR